MVQSKQEEKDSILRDTFVQMLFALTAAEIARQSADLVTEELTTWNDAPAYTHLIVAIALVATSWVGWKRSRAPGKRQDIEKVFSWQFVVLLIDVVLVVCYFIIAKGVEIERMNGVVIKITPSAALETFWIMMVFAGYCFWDIIANVVIKPLVPKTQPSTGEPSIELQQEHKEPWNRLWDSANTSSLCLGLAFFLWLFLHDVTKPWNVVFVDAALLSLVFLFRAIKQEVQWWTYALVATFVAFFFLAYA